MKARAPVAANRLRSALKSLFAWAVGQGLLTSSPMDGIAKPTREKKTADDIRALTDAELVLLWREIEKARLAPGIIAAFKVLALTGQRPAEIAGLSLAELRHLDDAANAVAEMPAERMKAPPAPRLADQRAGRAGSSRSRSPARTNRPGSKAGRSANTSSPRGSPIARTLPGIRSARRSGAIIDGLDTTGADGAVVRGLQADRPTPHSFRRTVATGMARLRIPREDRSAVLAHVEDDVLGGHYDAWDRLPEKRIALDAWARHVEELLVGSQVDRRCRAPGPRWRAMSDVLIDRLRRLGARPDLFLLVPYIGPPQTSSTSPWRYWTN